jgi:hypothetical protein
VLHPDQFQVNEAWIAFKLNEVPICTEEDGDFNVVALMDAASCFILNSTFVPVSKAEQTKLESRRSLKEAHSHKQQWPKTLFIPTGHSAKNLAAEAKVLGIPVVQVPEDQLLVFIGEARQGFKEHFGGGAMQ